MKTRNGTSGRAAGRSLRIGRFSWRLPLLLCAVLLASCGNTVCCAPAESKSPARSQPDCRKGIVHASFVCRETPTGPGYTLDYRRAVGLPFDLLAHAEKRSRQLCGGSHFSWLAAESKSEPGVGGEDEVTSVNVTLSCGGASH